MVEQGDPSLQMQVVEEEPYQGQAVGEEVEVGLPSQTTVEEVEVVAVLSYLMEVGEVEVEEEECLLGLVKVEEAVLQVCLHGLVKEEAVAVLQVCLHGQAEGEVVEEEEAALQVCLLGLARAGVGVEGAHWVLARLLEPQPLFSWLPPDL